MGNETILYYVFEETITGCKKITKRHFFKKIKPRSFGMEDEGISVVTVMIPTLDKGWNRKQLFNIMNRGIAEYADYLRNAKVVMQPAIRELLGQPESFQTVFWTLAEKLFVDNFSLDSRQQVPESAVLLMGNSFFPEEQIERFIGMMQPYFARINYLAIMYEADDNEEISEERWKSAIDDFAEKLYYEYGLVVDVYRSEGCGKQGLREANTQEQTYGKRTGNMYRQLKTLYIDYGYKGRLPYTMMRQGGVYIDLLSCIEKEQRIRKKCSEISYLSPMKYLDTMVKSGYDKLVN